MVYNTTDSEYYRKAARVLHTLRYVVLLLLVLLVIIGFTAYKRELTLENFRYIMRYADFDLGTDYLGANQISFTALDDTEFGYVKGDLALLSSKYFTTYDFTGSVLVEEKLAYLNPSLKTAEKYALAYDVGGTGLSIYNSYSCIYSDEFEYGIKDADIKSDGSFAVLTSGKYLSGKVIVYGANLEEKFTWETRDKELVAVSLPEGTNKVNFVTLKVEGGDFVFSLYSYDLRNEDPVFVKDYYGEFPLKLYSDSESVCVLTDSALHFVSSDGTEIASYSHTEDTLTGFYESGDYIALTYAKSISKNSTMKLFAKGGAEITSDDFENNIISFSAYGKNIYALEKGKLHIREVNTAENTLEYKNLSELEVDSLYCGVFAKSGNEYILVSPKGAGKFS